MVSIIKQPPDMTLSVNGNSISKFRIISISEMPAPNFTKIIAQIFEPITIAAGDSIIAVITSGDTSKSYEARVEKVTQKVSNKIICTEFTAAHIIKNILNSEVTNYYELIGNNAEFNDWDTIPKTINLIGRSDSLHSINGKQTHIFSSKTNASPWTASALVNYLLSVHLPEDWQRPTLSELNDIFENDNLCDIKVLNNSILEILESICKQNQVKLSASSAGKQITFYSTGNPSSNFTLKLQDSGSLYNPELSNFNSYALTSNNANNFKTIKLLGDFKTYESTFELQPGWTSSYSIFPKEFQKSSSENFRDNQNSFRKWVLNETGNYSGTQFLLKSISSDFKKTEGKFFTPPVSKDSQGKTHNYLVEFKSKSEANWKVYPGTVWGFENECAIYFDDDKLPADYLKLAIAEQVQVRITASIASDVRLKHILPNVQSKKSITKVFDDAKWHAAAANSVYNSTNSESIIVNDIDKLQTRASKLVQANTFANIAEFTLPEINTAASLGQVLKLSATSIQLPASDIFIANEILHDFKTLSTKIKFEG